MSKFLILVSGPQGSGKSTQAELLAEKYGAPLFEAGVELRALVERREPGSAEIEAFMKRGDLVPHHYVDDLFTEFSARNQGEAMLVSDGYPRNLPELTIAERLAGQDGRKIIGVNVDLDETTAIERIISRAKARGEGHEDRPDNAPSAIKERLRLYHEETVPVLDQIKANHRLFVVDGTPSISEVSATIAEHVASLVTHDA
jgi:adenylate kinase